MRIPRLPPSSSSFPLQNDKHICRACLVLAGGTCTRHALLPLAVSVAQMASDSILLLVGEPTTHMSLMRARSVVLVAAGEAARGHRCCRARCRHSDAGRCHQLRFPGQAQALCAPCRPCCTCWPVWHRIQSPVQGRASVRAY